MQILLFTKYIIWVIIGCLLQIIYVYICNYDVLSTNNPGILYCNCSVKSSVLMTPDITLKLIQELLNIHNPKKKKILLDVIHDFTLI